MKFEKKHLLIRYFEGELSDSELMALRAWLDKRPENRKMLKELLSLHRMYKSHEVYSEISHQGALEQAIAHVRKVKRRRRYISLRRVVSVAAVVVMALVGSWLVLEYRGARTSENQFSGLEQSNPISSGSRKAILVLNSGESVVLQDVQDSLIAIASGGVVRKGADWLNYQGQDLVVKDTNTVRTPHGGEFTLILSDGTKVWLNALSELRYPVSFSGNNREVELRGEAYLEVAHDADHPFIVNTPHGKVHVLGTSFNVKDYDQDGVMTTTLVEGKVNLEYEKGCVELLPSMQAIVTEDSECVDLRKVDPSEYTAWTRAEFVFRNQSLEEIMNVLSRWYEFEYEFVSPALKTMVFSADINRYDDLQSLLVILEKTGEVRFEVEGKSVKIKK